MKIIFAKNNKPISLLIRLVTWSKWSHCGAITPDGKHVIESKGGCGVIKTPIEKFKERYKKYDIGTVDCDEEYAFRFLEEQLGKDYDLKAIFGILLRTGWDNGHQWFCSEVLAGAINIFRKDSVSRITPEHLWMITR